MQRDISTNKIKVERQIMKDMRFPQLKKFSCIIAFKYISFNRQILCKVTKLYPNVSTTRGTQFGVDG